MHPTLAYMHQAFATIQGTLYNVWICYATRYKDSEPPSTNHCLNIIAKVLANVPIDFPWNLSQRLVLTDCSTSFMKYAGGSFLNGSICILMSILQNNGIDGLASFYGSLVP